MLKLEKVHEDFRGIIYILVGDSLKEHEEITLFCTQSGFARGGCIHRENDEFNIVLEGVIEYFVGKQAPVTLQRGQSVRIPAKTPHYYASLTDSIVAEWGATPIEKEEKHLSTRKIVDRINLNQKNCY